jgi:phage terminase large subunit-like protein
MEDAKDFAKIANDYARGAVADKKGKTHSLYVRQAAKRHLSDLKKQRRKAYPYKFDPWYANDVCDVGEKMPHVKGKWSEDNLIVLEPAQIFWLACIFGWRKKSDETRRFTQVYIEVARKNAKSTLMAIVAHYCQNCEGEVGPEIYIAATTGAQADKVFQPARLMALKTPEMIEAFGLKVWARSIESVDNGGFMQPINSKASTQDGHNPHAVILDEFHAHKDRALYDVMDSAMGARTNPLMAIITTAGFNLSSACYELRQLFIKMLAGVVELDHVFAVIYTLDEGDDPFDEAVWIKANPLLGVSVQLDYIRAKAKEALSNPGSEGNFKTKHLNIWLNAAGAWLNAAQWAACSDESLELDDFIGHVTGIGIDLADKDDIAALVVEAYKDDVVYWFVRFYIPEDMVILREKEQADLYQTWVDQGFVIATPGDFIDHAVIEADLRALCEKTGFNEPIFDQYGGAEIMVSRLNEDGIEAKKLPKNAKYYTDPAKDLEARVKVRKFRHTGNPVMNWMASNVVVDRRVDGSLLPKKERANSSLKIDGIDAGLMASWLRLQAIEEDNTDDWIASLKNEPADQSNNIP